MYDKKYIIEEIEEFNEHNDLYDNIKGSICYPAYFKVGERGWFLYESDYWYNMKANRVCTTEIKSVEYIDDMIIVVTQNTKFTFRLVKE